MKVYWPVKENVLKMDEVYVQVATAPPATVEIKVSGEDAYSLRSCLRYRSDQAGNLLRLATEEEIKEEELQEEEKNKLSR